MTGEETGARESCDAASADPHTAASARIHARFEGAMAEKGLLEDDGKLTLDPNSIRHDQPPGTEQTPG